MKENKFDTGVGKKVSIESGSYSHAPKEGKAGKFRSAMAKKIKSASNLEDLRKVKTKDRY